METGLILSPDPARNARLRRDLQRIHRAMGSATSLRRATARLGLDAPPRRVLDLGAGDGTRLLHVVRERPASWHGAELTLLDLHDAVADPTREAFASLGCQVRVEKVDVIDWARNPHPGGYDLCTSVLFLHRLDKDSRTLLLRAIARRSTAFVACEPRRSALARLGSRFAALLGSSEMARDDAIAGVAAGFTGRELSDTWSAAASGWALEEYASGLFMHCFSAVRATQHAADRSGAAR